MKVSKIVKVLGCFVVCFAFVAGAQSDNERSYRKIQNLLHSYYVDMQNGLRQLNCNPYEVGVTPLNGALLLNETDLSVPGRHGSLPVIRHYNSKIWFGDTVGIQPHSTLFYDYTNEGMGVGWNMHFGKLEWNAIDPITYYYIAPNGIRINIQPYNYYATDGSFMRLKGDTLKVGDGTNLIFGFNEGDFKYVSKIIDPNGNITTIHYEWHSGRPYLDSVKTSTNRKIAFYYNIHTGDHLTLDSMRYLGYGNNLQKIVYHYNYNVDIDSSPFSPYIDTVCLLKSVIYPNGDSVYYDYNQYCELTGSHTAGNGLIKYEYATDSFQIPDSLIFPPDGNTLRGKLQMTRSIVKVKEYDPWTAPDTNITQYRRVRTKAGDLRAISNPDSVKVTDAEGNYHVSYYGCTRGPWYDGRDLLHWVWEKHGRLDSTISCDKNHNRMWKQRTETIQIIDYIAVPYNSTTWIGSKTYCRRDTNYDDYGNTWRIYEMGDSATASDDYWVFRKFFNADTTAKSKICFWWAGVHPDEWLGVQDSFYSEVGLDSIKVIRRWWTSALTDSVESINTTYYSPPANQGFVGSYPAKAEGKKYLRVISKAYYSGYNLQIIGNRINLYDYGSPPGVPPAESIVTNDYRNKGLYHLIKEEYIAPNSEGTDILSKTKYYYDSTDCIVRIYSPLDWWEAPLTPQNVRGNPARIEQWKGSDEYVKSEFRYDIVGNLVQAITHPSTNTAETTFTSYDPPSDPDKYQYAFPWLTVNHLSTSVCSLYTRTEYDSATWLVIKTFDANGDSIIFAYDSLNRLTKAWAGNAANPTHTITYKDSASPEAILDSTQIDANRWIVNKTFVDGFGRVIQTQQIDYDNGKTIVQNIAYNKNGLQDSVCNAYTISGTAGDYSTPSWSQVTSCKYDGLNRISTIIHPTVETTDSIYIKYYANADTVYDEKGNKTAYIYNAYGSIDTIIDALDNKTIYRYDTLGRLTRVINAENDTTLYYYDKLSRLVAYDCPDAKSSLFYGSDSADALYEYDDVGNLTRKKDANGWVDYSYDDIYRLTVMKHTTDEGSTWPDTIRLTYDFSSSAPSESSSYYDNPKGRLGKMVTCGVDSIRYYYDDRGNLTRKSVVIKGLEKGAAQNLTNRYNIANACTSLFVGGVGYHAQYHYDSRGMLTQMANLVNNIKYSPAGQIVNLNYSNDVFDTIAYDSRLRPTYIRAYTPQGNDWVKLLYKYEKNSNVDSIHDYLVSTNCQGFTYDSLNRLTNVESSGGDQSFEYDKVGNRTKKNGASYSYYTNTNRLQEDHRSYKYYYDDNGNILTHRTGTPGTTIDSFAYDWLNRIKFYKDIDTGETLSFAYNASGLRVKKYYYCPDRGEGQGESGTLFSDAAGDLGMKSTGADTVYNKGRDIEKIYIKNEANYFTFTIVNRYLFNESNKMKLFITLDLDTIQNSGRITLPEDTLTMVPAKAAWEYCVYIGDNDFGLYNKNGNKVSKPFGMLAEKVFGDSGRISVKVAKSLLNNVPAIRYTITTTDPQQQPDPDPLWQGGSSATDVFPGTPATFGGEINGYGEISESGILSVTTYTIYYVYDGINPIIEYSPGGSILNRYIYAGGMHIARVAGADTNWYHCDALGSPRRMTSETPSGVWSATYYPFGEATTLGTNTHQFTGKEMDSEMGLNYFCQRYYDPQIGRFMSLDPQDSPALSPYAYCANNPLKFTDPTGTHTERIPYDFSEEQWSWIEQNMFRINKAERLAQRAGMFFAKSAQMDPDFWNSGWQYTYMDKFNMALADIARSEWGKKYGAAILKQLYLLRACGQINIIAGYQSFSAGKDYPDLGLKAGLNLGTFAFDELDLLALTLIHEGAHSAFRGIYGGGFTNMTEGASLMFESSYFFTELSTRSHRDMLGFFERPNQVAWRWALVMHSCALSPLTLEQKTTWDLLYYLEMIRGVIVPEMIVTP